MFERFRSKFTPQNNYANLCENTKNTPTFNKCEMADTRQVNTNVKTLKWRTSWTTSQCHKTCGEKWFGREFLIFLFLNSEWKEKARRARKLKTYNEFWIFDRGNESRIEISNFLSKITGNLHLPFIYHFLQRHRSVK